MKSIYTHAFAIFAMVIFLGCGDSSGPSVGSTSKGDSSERPAAPGQLQIVVHRARQTKTSNLEIVATLANGTGAPSAPIQPSLFQVKTKSGLYFGANGDELSWVKQAVCEWNASLAAGESYTCAMAFDIDASQSPIELRYSTPNALAGIGDDQRIASTAIELEPCVMCGDDCTYTDIDEEHCGECDVRIGRKQFCDNGLVRCLAPEEIDDAGTATSFELCDGVCVDLETDKNNCGACGKPAPGRYCEFEHQ